MKRYAGDLIHDLRERKLLPVALLLIAAIVAVPVFLLKPSSSATDSASTTAPAVTDTGAAISAQLLEPGDPQPSDLEAFRARDPFAAPRVAKPLKATEEAFTASSTPAPGGGSGGGESQSGSGGGDTPSPAPESTPDTPEPQSEPQQRSFAYALDLTFVGQKGPRHYRNLQRLRMLPSTSSPLLVFLGIEDGGSRATFLVDATVKLAGGEGTCTPSRVACATLSLEPGEQQTFADDQDRQYMIQVDQIRERELAKASSSSPRAGIAQPSGLERRFVMPSLVDVVNEIQR